MLLHRKYLLLLYYNLQIFFLEIILNLNINKEREIPSTHLLALTISALEIFKEF